MTAIATPFPAATPTVSIDPGARQRCESTHSAPRATARRDAAVTEPPVRARVTYFEGLVGARRRERRPVSCPSRPPPGVGPLGPPTASCPPDSARIALAGTIAGRDGVWIVRCDWAVPARPASPQPGRRTVWASPTSPMTKRQCASRTRTEADGAASRSKTGSDLSSAAARRVSFDASSTGSSECAGPAPRAVPRAPDGPPTQRTRNPRAGAGFFGRDGDGDLGSANGDCGRRDARRRRRVLRLPSRGNARGIAAACRGRRDPRGPRRWRRRPRVPRDDRAPPASRAAAARYGCAPPHPQPASAPRAR